MVQYRFDTFEPFVLDYIENISETGVLIADPEITAPVGSVVYLQFILRDGTKLIEGLSRVIRVEEDPGAMALEFVDFDEESKSLLRRLVEEGATEDLPTEDLLYPR